MLHYHTYTDQELLSCIQNGDKIAFRELYDRYWKLLFSVALSKIDSYVEAEEIVQEIYTDIWARRETIQIKRSVKYYLAAAVKYQVMTILTKRNQQRKLQNGISGTNLSISEPADQYLTFRELQDELEAIVSALPERCQLIYRLSREEGMPNKEIAHQLDISEKTVETQLSRAMSRLRSGLSDAAFTLFF